MKEKIKFWICTLKLLWKLFKSIEVLGPLQLKWLLHLIVYPERQGKNKLGWKTPTGYKACCMGEGGLIAGVCEWFQLHDNSPEVIRVKRTTDKPDEHEFIAYLDGEKGDAYKALGLYGSMGQRKDRVGSTNSLSALNDNGITWPGIAEIILEDPSQYFREVK